MGTPAPVYSAWGGRLSSHSRWDISEWAGQTIQLRVEALDANLGSLIEAGVDKRHDHAAVAASGASSSSSCPNVSFMASCAPVPTASSASFVG